MPPDGWWIAQALTEGFNTNIWVVSTRDGAWRQITDRRTADPHRPQSIVVIR
jgi:hypothetical protein